MLIILLVFVIVGVIVGLQVVSTRGNKTDPTVVGRPLSNAQTHLHTVAVGSRPGTLYLGTHYGIFTSTDNGRTWPQARGVLSTLMVTAIATSPDDANMLALIGIPSVTGGAAAGAYFSQDGGANWTLRNPPNLSKEAYPYTIKASAANDQHFYVYYLYAGWFETWDGTGGPLLRATLRTCRHPLCSRLPTIPITCSWEEIRDFSRARTTGSIVYGLAGRSVWYSQDGGAMWTARKQFQRGDFTAFLIDPRQADRLYIGFFLPAQVVYTTDSGKNWRVLTDSTTP